MTFSNFLFRSVKTDATLTFTYNSMSNQRNDQRLDLQNGEEKTAELLVFLF